MSNPFASPGTDLEPEFYKHTGAMPLPGLLLTVGLGAIAAAVMGVIYTFGIVYIPYIFICFALTCGFAVGLGFGWGSWRGLVTCAALAPLD